MTEKRKTDVRKLTVLGLLSAIIAVTAFIPIRTLGLEITLCMVPVAVGGALYGGAFGAMLGLVFGAISFFQCFGYSAFGTTLFQIDPVLMFLTCVPTRVLAGALAGAAAQTLRKRAKTMKARELSYPVAAILAPVLNTVFFMTVLCLCFYRTDYIQSFVTMLNAGNVFVFVLLFIGLNGAAEIAAGFVIAYPVTRALVKALKLSPKTKTDEQTEVTQDNIEI